jgi:hypothetical protein
MVLKIDYITSDTILPADINTQNTQINTNTSDILLKVSKSGDTMTGNLTVPDATSSSHAVNKSQLDNVIPRNFIDGFALVNNATTPNTQIDINIGVCADSTNASKMALASLMTKKLNAVWAVGSGNGGLDTGAKAINTWYHVFVISKADGTTDALFSTSATAPTMPSGYVNKRRLGSIRTDASGNIKTFIQTGDWFKWTITSYINEITSSGTVAQTALTITVPSIVGIRPILRLGITANAAMSSIMYVFDKNTGTAQLVQTNNGFATGTECSSLFALNSQIDYIVTNNPSSFSILNNGYIDMRGKQ